FDTKMAPRMVDTVLRSLVLFMFLFICTAFCNISTITFSREELMNVPFHSSNPFTRLYRPRNFFGDIGWRSSSSLWSWEETQAWEARWSAGSTARAGVPNSASIRSEEH